MTATSLVFSESSRPYSLMISWPVSSTGMIRSFAPVSATSICHGTIFAWCSRCDRMISSPRRMLAFPQLLATRLMASVAPRTKMMSFSVCAPMNLATVLRAPS